MRKTNTDKGYLTLLIVTICLGLICIYCVGATAFFYMGTKYNYVMADECDKNNYTHKLYNELLSITNDNNSTNCKTLINKIDLTEIDCNSSRIDIKSLLISEMNIQPFLYFEKNEDEFYKGYMNPVLRMIVINNKTIKNNLEFTYTFCHELTHLKYMNNDEMFVQFHTFKVLYESKNTLLKEAGIRFAISMLNEEFTGSNYEYNYDASNYVIRYLKNYNY